MNAAQTDPRPALRDPIIWIVSTGTEILQGHYPDRNAQWLSARLLELGLAVARHMAVPDNRAALHAALALAAREADLVVTTGGLGPTGDDLNRFVMSEIWGAPLELEEKSLGRIRARFKRRGRQMPPSNEVQAHLPRGAIVLDNDEGTAPGFYLRPAVNTVRATLLALPGPPREMRPMFEHGGAPLVLEDFAAGRRVRRTLTFHTIGLAESWIDQRVRDCFDADARVNFALLAALGKVDIRLTLMGGDADDNAALEAQWRETIHGRIGAENIYGENETTLESAVGALLRERRQSLATAESCTGGMLAGRVTDAPGASDYFREGFVTYANDAKMARLGVSESLLREHGAVSAPVAAAMARGALAASGATWALSVTGIAGPGGGTAEKPVGLVYFGLAGPLGGEDNVRTLRHVFLGGRDDVRAQAAQAALNILRLALLGAPLEAGGTLDRTR
jgi:nicotinamide-nucleotide amidase